ncbi:MAG: phosphate acyltransferase PlsX [Alphaproteobacteria bacterium]|nr:phosphate acyltransferase PlsX [Alphaproteobacteria bacterium]
MEQVVSENNNLVISIDAMGGDNSPRVVIEGLAIAAKKNQDMRFILFGDESKVSPILNQYPDLLKVCELRHTTEMVRNEDKPSQVIRNRNTSMYMAIDAVRKGEAQAIVSAGNTGALMAISKLVLKTIQKIHRPAIVSIMPHYSGKYVMLDLGANTECSAINLAEFALMGDILARHALGIDKPRVALLNIGAEEMKGKEEIRQAAQIIKNSNMNIDFRGYIEPHEIPNGVADVIVSDGFTGNIALKSTEGTARLVIRMVKNAIKQSFWAKIGLPFMLGVILKIKKTMDPRLYNGAMFVGLNGLSVKSHGGTDALGFSVAVNNAASLVRRDFVSTIRKEVENMDLDELSQEAIYDVY